MKATVIEDEISSDITTATVILFFVGLLLIILYRMCLNKPPDYGSVVSFLKDMQGVEAEDAGETNSNYLLDISISAVTQYFDLNSFVETMQKMGCRVVSTSDTNNPSHRKLTLQIPKTTKGMGSILFLFLGIVVGIITICYSQKENLYIRFLILEPLKKYV